MLGRIRLIHLWTLDLARGFREVVQGRWFVFDVSDLFSRVCCFCLSKVEKFRLRYSRTCHLRLMRLAAGVPPHRTDSNFTILKTGQLSVSINIAAVFTLCNMLTLGLCNEEQKKTSCCDVCRCLATCHKSKITAP
eukprot:scaffold155695_cov14-Prasinocladus_malaysianus.AAC.1